MKMLDIKNQDCIEYLKSLPSESVDLVLTDPPYNIGVDGGKGWDSENGDTWGPDKNLPYLDWCKLWTDECVRVLKPNRMLIVWGTLKTDDFLKYKLNVLNSYPDMVGQQEIIWGYNWGGRTNSNFARKHEYAWCYSKGEKFLFNADDVRIERAVQFDMNKQKKMLNAFKNYKCWSRGDREPTKEEISIYKKEVIEPITEFKKGSIPTSIWQKNNHTTSNDYCGWHNTTKNIEILERMISAYTNKGDTVLDIFMGSGSTAIAASNLERKIIGCEKDEEYYPKMMFRTEVSQYQNWYDKNKEFINKIVKEKNIEKKEEKKELATLHNFLRMAH